MRKALVVVLVVASLAGAARADLTEPPRQRQGYYFAVGTHGAVAYAREDAKDLGPLRGFLGSVRMGQLLTPRLGLGLTVDYGGASGDEQQAGFGGLYLAGQLEVARNLAVHASVGLGVLSLSSPNDDAGEVRGTAGTAYTFGLTYDWFPAKRRSGGYALSPSIQLRVLPGATASMAAFLGVELTRWSGLDRDQLDLPPGEAFEKAP